MRITGLAGNYSKSLVSFYDSFAQANKLYLLDSSMSQLSSYFELDERISVLGGNRAFEQTMDLKLVKCSQSWVALSLTRKSKVSAYLINRRINKLTDHNIGSI